MTMYSPSSTLVFQSTPSSQRETIWLCPCSAKENIFQSTPSSQRETQSYRKKRRRKRISIHSLFAEGDSKNAQKYLLPTYILHTKPTITQANPSLKLIFSNLFSKLTPFSRCESPTHFMCTYHSHLNHISNFFKPVPSPQLFPLFRYFDPG